MTMLEKGAYLVKSFSNKGRESWDATAVGFSLVLIP